MRSTAPGVASTDSSASASSAALLVPILSRANTADPPAVPMEVMAPLGVSSSARSLGSPAASSALALGLQGLVRIESAEALDDADSHDEHEEEELTRPTSARVRPTTATAKRAVRPASARALRPRELAQSGSPSERPQSPLPVPVLHSTKSFHPAFGQVELEASSAAPAVTPALASTTFEAIARSLPPPLPLHGIQPEDLDLAADPSPRHGARPSSASTRVAFGSGSARDASTTPIDHSNAFTPALAATPSSSQSARSRPSSALPSRPPLSARARPPSASFFLSPRSSEQPFDMHAELEAAFSAAAATAASDNAHVRSMHARATNASMRAWSVSTKMVRPVGISARIPEGLKPSCPSTATPQRPPQHPTRPSTATPSRVAAPDLSPVGSPRRPTSAIATRPSSRPFAAGSPGAPPVGVPGHSPLLAPEAGLYRGDPADQIASIYAHATHRTEAQFEAAEAARSTAPPFVPDVGLNLYTGLEPDRERETAQGSANSPVRVRPAPGSAAPSPARRIVRDILTGEDHEVDDVLVREEEDDSADEAEAAALVAPSSSILVSGQGGLFSFRLDAPPSLVTKEEDTFNDRGAFKSPRLRHRQALERMAHEEAQAGTSLNPGNLPAWHSYDDYAVKNMAHGQPTQAMQRDQQAADAALAAQVDALINGNVAADTADPTPPSHANLPKPVLRSREPDVFYPSSFIPAHLLSDAQVTAAAGGDVAALSAAGLGSGSLVTLGTAKAIGDFGSVRPLTAVPLGAKKTAKRVRAESAHEERRRKLLFDQLATKLMNNAPVPSTSAPVSIPQDPSTSDDVLDPSAGDAQAQALRRAAIAQRRQILGMHYHTPNFRARMLDNTATVTKKPVRPASAGSAYSQQHLHRRAASASLTLGGYDTPAEREPLNGRSAGAASTCATNLLSSAHGVAVRIEITARKAAQRAHNRATLSNGFVDINALNEAARVEALRLAELGPAPSRTNHGSNAPASTLPMQIATVPLSVPAPAIVVPYFGKKDVRAVHGQVRKQKEQEARDDEEAQYRTEPEEQFAQEEDHEAAAAGPDLSEAVESTPELEITRSSIPASIPEEKSNDLAAEAAALALSNPPFQAGSTRASRLRYMATPRAATLMGNAIYALPRGYLAPTSPVRLANSPGVPRAYTAEALLQFQPREWAASAMARVNFDELPRPQTEIRVHLPGPRDRATLDDVLATSSTPRVVHACFPLRTNVLSLGGSQAGPIASGAQTAHPASARPASARVPVRPTSARPPQAKKTVVRGRAPGSATPTPVSASPALVKGLASVPLSARHSYARPASARTLASAATAPIKSALATHSSDGSSSGGSQVRALKMVSFNAEVMAELPHHPDESRLFRSLFTPSSVIASQAYRAAQRDA